MLAGIVLGPSVLKLVDSHEPVLHFLAELGVVILLVEIGLETELKKLLAVGGAAAAVAAVGVVLPYLLGIGVGRLLGLPQLATIVAAATLTATSVGITARVLSDLNRLHEPESQIILGAAVIDDILGLVILAIVARMAAGGQVTFGSVVQTAAIAFGFLIATLLLGRFVVPPLVKHFGRLKLPGTLTMIAVVLAFGLAWLAAECGSAVIIGALAAGLLLRGTPQHEEIQRGVAHLGHFFVPLFFVTVGSEVDLSVLNPLVAANRHTLEVGGLLIVAAVAGKFAAGYAPYWFRGRKAIIGVGMIPRGEVGLILRKWVWRAKPSTPACSAPRP